MNLNCIDVYAVLERTNDRKLHVFATKPEVNTYSEHLGGGYMDVLRAGHAARFGETSLFASGLARFAGMKNATKSFHPGKPG